MIESLILQQLDACWMETHMNCEQMLVTHIHNSGNCLARSCVLAVSFLHAYFYTEQVYKYSWLAAQPADNSSILHSNLQGGGNTAALL